MAICLDDVIVPAWTENGELGERNYPSLTLGDLLDCLVEECAEIIQAAQKCKRFGYTRNYAGYGANDKQLATEIGDLLGIVRRLPLEEDWIEVSAQEKIRNIADHKKAI